MILNSVRRFFTPSSGLSQKLDLPKSNQNQILLHKQKAVIIPPFSREEEVREGLVKELTDKGLDIPAELL